MEQETPSAPRDWNVALLRICSAVAVAAALAIALYFLLDKTRPEGGLISATFLITMPATTCAFIAYVTDPFARLKFIHYALIPGWTGMALIAISIVWLGEGVICTIMLLPLWVMLGLAGSVGTWAIRRKFHSGRSYCLALLTLPFAMMQVEPLLPVPQASETVTRSVVIDASPERIWPMLRGIGHVGADEGRWNVSQDVLGIPRPVGASLNRDGIGADRSARWTQGVRFREVITDWQQHRRIGWRFVFDDIDQWAITDRHLIPDSSYFKVTDGGYTIESLPGGRARVTLHTRYWMRTHVNGYARLWGELVLGDLEDNLLALIEARAEA